MKDTDHVQQTSLPLPDQRDLAAPQTKQAEQAKVAEGCPYHNGRFEYNCFICNPR